MPKLYVLVYRFFLSTQSFAQTFRAFSSSEGVTISAIGFLRRSNFLSTFILLFKKTGTANAVHCMTMNLAADDTYRLNQLPVPDKSLF